MMLYLFHIAWSGDEGQFGQPTSITYIMYYDMDSQLNFNGGGGGWGSNSNN